jgi:hypothetical protein
MTSTTTPAGWYPDPSDAAGGGLRYWDGSQWTEHLAPGAPPVVAPVAPVAPVVPATPATPAGWYPDPQGGAGRRYWDGAAWTEHFAKDAILDAELRRPMRRKTERVVLTDERLSKGDDESIAFDQVEHVAYWVMVLDGGAFHGTRSFHFRMFGGGADVDLDFGVLPADNAALLHEHAFETLVAASKQHVEPRLRDLAVGKIEAGETVTIGGIDVSGEGLANGRKRVAWSDYGDVAFEHDYLRVHDRAGKEMLKGNGGTDGPLAAVLFATCAASFGS